MTADKARKKAIRARMAATGEPYSEAARHVAEGEPETPALQITEIRFVSPPVAANWDTPRTYRCHHCGASGAFTRAVAIGSSTSCVLEDGSTYVLAHCPACLPEVEGEGWTEAHSEHSSRSWELTVAARNAMRAGELPGALDTDFYRCSVCGGAWDVDPRIRLPLGVLLDTSTDLYEHPCPYCWGERGAEACGQEHAARARSLARGGWG